jgi:hypothetical protein
LKYVPKLSVTPARVSTFFARRKTPATPTLSLQDVHKERAESKQENHSARIEALLPERVLESDRTTQKEFVVERPSAEPLHIHIGDHILLQNREDSSRPRVGSVERLWTTRSGGRVVTYTVFLYPSETHHPSTRTFYTNEVIQTGESFSQPVEEVLRKCLIQHPAEYMQLEPVGIAAKDCFVCESKYTIKGQNFKSVKIL